MRCASEGKCTIYYGESGFSSYQRGKNHLEGLRNRNPENVLYQHERDHHPTTRLEKEDFEMKLTGSFTRLVVRLTQVGAMISRALKAQKQGLEINLLNSKREFNQAGVINPKFGGLF